MNAESFTSADVLGGDEHAAPSGSPDVESGCIGWDGDSGDVHDLGTTQNDGNTLVKVQLFRGRDSSEPYKEGVAQGHQIWARLTGPFWYIPAKGTQCFVAFPGGFQEGVGVGVVFGLPGPSPSIQFSKTRAVMDLGAGMDLIIKARSVTLSDYAGNFIQVGSAGGNTDYIKLVTSNGDLVAMKPGAIGLVAVSGGDGKAFLQLTTTKIDMNLKGGAAMKFSGSNWQTVAPGQGLLNFASVGFGAAPSVPIVIGPTGLSGIGSTSMFGTP